MRHTIWNETYQEYRNAPDISINKCMDKLAAFELTGLEEPIDVTELIKSEDYWHREALKWAARLGESKIKFRELLDQFGIPEDNFKDDELEKFLYDNRQQDKEDADAERS